MPRMAIVIPDLEPVDRVWEKNRDKPPPFEQIVVDTVRELTKLNPQGHVHVTELYAAVNIVQPLPPGRCFPCWKPDPGLSMLEICIFDLMIQRQCIKN